VGEGGKAFWAEGTVCIKSEEMVTAGSWTSVQVVEIQEEPGGQPMTRVLAFILNAVGKLLKGLSRGKTWVGLYFTKLPLGPGRYRFSWSLAK
jgi:hypothetical protein